MKENQRMIENGSKEPEFFTIFLCFILALLGGTARELSKANEKFEWKRFFSNIFISGFCGLMVGLAAPDFEHKNWIMIIAGISGTAGTQFLDFCFEVLKAALSKTINIDTKKK